MNPKGTLQRKYKFSKLNAFAHQIMDWTGSVQSLIVHTFLFAGSFTLVLFGFDFSNVLLVLTTIVSLEAIYLAIFIQMAVNQNSQSLDAVEEDIDEIQKDVDEIQEDVDKIEKEKEDLPECSHEEQNAMMLTHIESHLVKLMDQLEKIKEERRSS